MVFAQCTEDWKAGSGNFHSAVRDEGKPTHEALSGERVSRSKSANHRRILSV